MSAALGRIRLQAEALGATFFEIVVALACVLFAEAGAEVAVMEVGLGGRLDATNALDPRLSIVTGVALDHTEILGQTVELIAAEKAGILRPGRPAVTGIVPELLPLLERTGADVWLRGVKRRLKPPARLGRLGRDPEKPRRDTHVPHAAAGRTRRGNAALAALAAQRLGLGTAAIQSGAAQVRWPGRLEKLSWRGREVLLDGAHNPDGARALVAALRGLGVERLPVVFGAAGDKDLAGVVAELEQVASELIVTRAPAQPARRRPAGAGPAVQRADPRDGRVADTPAEALDLLPPGLSLVCGSLYLVGEVRPLLTGEVGEARERWQ